MKPFYGDSRMPTDTAFLTSVLAAAGTTSTTLGDMTLTEAAKWVANAPTARDQFLRHRAVSVYLYTRQSEESCKL